MDRIVEIEAAEALLDIGASVPLKELKLPFRRKPVVLRFTMKRPCLGSQIRIARLYLQLGVSFEEMERFTKDEEFAFMAAKGGVCCRMVALTLCRGPVTGWLFSRFVAWLLRWFVEDVYILGASLRFVTLLGTKPFMTIISCASRTNPMIPKLSQARKGS